MKTYRLIFLRKAAREWNKLESPVRQQFEKKLGERLVHPRVPGDQLREYADCYRIKLRKAGYRLIYRVRGDEMVVAVVRIGKRDKGQVYVGLGDRLADDE